MMENNKNTKRTIRVGTRTSKLALTQTQMVLDLILANNVDVEFQLVTVDDLKEKICQIKMNNMINSQLFTKELELALYGNEIDFIVHSLKDIPININEVFVIGSISSRDSCDDAVILKKNSKYKNLSSLPEGSVVGTSSVRRIAQLKKRYPHLSFASIRGNLNTRLLKLDDPQQAIENGKEVEHILEGIVLAKVGLDRLNWKDRISEVLNYEDTLYAVGQGAIACECRRDDLQIRQLLATINDEFAMLTSIAERVFMATLGGGYSVPVSVRSQIKDGHMVLRGCVMSLDGNEMFMEELSKELPSSPELIDKSNTILNLTTNVTGIDIYKVDLLTIEKMSTCKEIGTNLANKIIEQGAGKLISLAKESRSKIKEIIV